MLHCTISILPMRGEPHWMRMLMTFVAMCAAWSTVSVSQTPSYEYGKLAMSRMFVDAHAPDQPPNYSRSEIKTMIKDAKTPEEFERLADYFDYRSLQLGQKADQELKELASLLAQSYHSRSYPFQLESSRERLKEYRSKAKEYSARASEYRAQAKPTEQTK